MKTNEYVYFHTFSVLFTHFSYTFDYFLYPQLKPEYTVITLVTCTFVYICSYLFVLCLHFGYMFIHISLNNVYVDGSSISLLKDRHVQFQIRNR